MSIAISVGQKSPWHLKDVPNDGGASLVLDAVIPLVVLFLPSPTTLETLAFNQGQIDFAFDRALASGFLICAFRQIVGKPPYVEVPFHVGKEEVANRNSFMILDEEGIQSGIGFVLQDGNGIVRSIRQAKLPEKIAGAMRNIVLEQIEDSGTPDWELRHQRQRKIYEGRTSSPEQAFRRAKVICKGSAPTSPARA